MNVLHVTPHLGGGVGKAHATLSPALPKSISQTYLLLEAPRDRRYADMVEASGARVVVANDLADVARLAREADIVQFEFWNHPRLYECLARCDFPAMRSAFWSHVSGLFKPVIQPALMEAAARFVFTTSASLAAPGVAALQTASPKKIAAINSGFGFANPPARKPAAGTPRIAYLGTVDFVKMHPGFFDAIDAIEGDDINVAVWGAASDEVTQRVRAMRHPQRIALRGQTADPRAALTEADIFFYPLQADHYGTAENVLIEAMSLGLPAIVLNNPAETAIVRDGVTGLIARDIDECTGLLQTLLASPELREQIGRQAMRDAAATRAPEISARAFADLWQDMLGEPARASNFRAAIGNTPADWFLATQCLPGATWTPATSDSRASASKGSLAHFENAAAGDASLAKLRQQTAI